MVATGTVSERDGTLDCLKGLAIILVVAGHTAQDSTPDFDNLFVFRAIYSFHMPMFMFLAGMVIAVSLRKVIPVQQLPVTVRSIASGIPKRVFRLLIPFFAWGIIALIYPGRPEETLGSWLDKLVWRPDHGLWFLLTLFDCYLVIAPCLILAAVLQSRSERGARSPAFGFLTVSLLLLIGELFLYAVPNGFGFALARVFFPFVALGILYQMYLPRGLALIVRIGAWAVFLLLLPFWHRLQGFSFLTELPHNFLTERLNTVFRVALALSGTSMTLDIARFLDRYGHAIVRQTLGKCGQRSLEIYALHTYFLDYRPLIVAPIALSIIVSLFLRNVPILGTILFGAAPLWPRQILRRLSGHPAVRRLLPPRLPESFGGPISVGATVQAEERRAERPPI
jgi:fucose 4-O-acetylase-like acetyltransferase